VATRADLPFQLDDADSVTLRSVPILACETCPEILIDKAVMRMTDEILELMRRKSTITDAQRRELDRRLDDLEREGPVGLTWDEMEAKARSRRE